MGKSAYQTDSDSALLLLGHRYYDPSIGRFLSSDPAQAGSNWYAYCGNNPLVWIDPLGFQNDGLLPPGPNGTPRLPPGYGPNWGNGKDARGPYVQDPDTGERWYPAPSEPGHWPHYHHGMPDKDGNPAKGDLPRYPRKCKKPWPNQKKPAYGDQSKECPWPDPGPSEPPQPISWRPVIVKVGLVLAFGGLVLAIVGAPESDPVTVPAIIRLGPKLIPAFAR